MNATAAVGRPGPLGVEPTNCEQQESETDKHDDEGSHLVC